MHQITVFYILLYSKCSDECPYGSSADTALRGRERDLWHDISRDKRRGRYHEMDSSAGGFAGFGRAYDWRVQRLAGDALRTESILGSMGSLDAAVHRDAENHRRGKRCAAVAVWHDWERRSADFECTSC